MKTSHSGSPPRRSRASSGKARPTKKRTVAEVTRLRDEVGIDTDHMRVEVALGKSGSDVLMERDDPRDWDDEELLRGRRRDKNGNFSGADPKVIPKAVYEEMQKRMLIDSRKKMTQMVETGLEKLKDILEGQDTADKDRLKAIQMLFDRTMGRTPEKVEVGPVRQPWEDLVVDSIVDGFDDEDTDPDASDD